MFRHSPAGRPYWLALVFPLALTTCAREAPEAPTEPGSGGTPILFRPLEWTFVGRATVKDPAGNPQSGVQFNLFATLGEYDVPDGEGEFDLCSAVGFSDAQGEVFVSCSIPDFPGARPLSLRFNLQASRFTVISVTENDRTALSVLKTYVAISDNDGNGITDAIELRLAKKFAPKLILTAGDQGVRPSPVEIMDRNGDSRLGWEDVLIWVVALDGTPLGEFRLDEILFYNSQDDYWFDGRYRYPYFALVMKDLVIPGFVIEGDNVIPLNPPTIYILVPHFEWGELGQTRPSSWFPSWDQAIATHANESRYVNGTTYVDLFHAPSGELVIQYWFFYPFNNSGNRHEGDWEHINVVVSSENVADARIERVEYYFHEKVEVARTAGQDYEVVDSTHPVVYVGGFTGACQTFGYGTHASYPRFGIINNINSAGSQENVGGDGIEIDFDNYQNILLMTNEMPRPIFIDDPNATYEEGWQTFGAFWGHPLSKPLSCASDINLFADILSGFLVLVEPGLPFGGVIALGIQLATAIFEDNVLEEINMAPLGPRFKPDRWQKTAE